METYVIDRFEGACAVLEGEDGKMHDFPLAQLPPQVRPGDVLRRENGVWCIDEAETDRRAREIRRLMDDIFRPE